MTVFCPHCDQDGDGYGRTCITCRLDERTTRMDQRVVAVLDDEIRLTERSTANLAAWHDLLKRRSQAGAIAACGVVLVTAALALSSPALAADEAVQAGRNVVVIAIAVLAIVACGVAFARRRPRNWIQRDPYDEAWGEASALDGERRP